MQDIRRYIYMDNNGIDSIIAQISENKIEEKNMRTITGGKNKINGLLGISKLLSSLLKAEVSATTESEYTTIIDERSTVSYERKIQLIIEYITNNGSMISSPYEIMEKYNNDRTNFINTKVNFDTNYKDWSDAICQAKKFNYITFVIGGNNKKYDENELYYKNIPTYGMKIIMNMNVNKLIGSFGSVSHLGTYFRLCKGENIPLGIFGHITKVNSIYQIKPYGIWIP